MKKLIIWMLMGLCLSLSIFTTSSAAQFLLSAKVTQATDLNVTLTKIDSKGTTTSSDDVWIGPATGINFGDLELRQIDPLDSSKIAFLPIDNSYYAADVGVNGAGPWTINHMVTGTDLLTTGDNALGNNIIVTFVKQITNTSAESLDKVTIMNSNKTYASSRLTGGWLRIYYGVAQGGTGEPADAQPIVTTKTAKDYSGTIQITLTTP